VIGIFMNRFPANPPTESRQRRARTPTTQKVIQNNALPRIDIGCDTLDRTGSVVSYALAECC
jgi:hypothetical protein